MYCSNCGKPASGRFCSNCGHSLFSSPVNPRDEQVDAIVAADANLITAELVEATSALASGWDAEICYERLIRVPLVRELIDRHAKQSRPGVSGEQFLKLCDKLMPMGVPMETLASIAQPIYASWGIKTGKQRTEPLTVAPGRAMVRLLCSLARRGQTLRTVKQAHDGCCFEAALPSDMLSFEGDLLVTVRRRQAYSEIEAATNIPGQAFDWGKSRRCLDRLFADLQADPA